MTTNNKQTIRVLKQKKLNYEVLAPPSLYAYNKNGRLKIIQRFFFSLLNKLKANYIQTDTTMVDEYYMDADDTINIIFENIKDIVECYNLKPKYVLIGKDNFLKLKIRDMDHFKVRTSYNHSDNRDSIDTSSPISLNSNFFAGLQVIIVPWMEGVLVVPDFEQS